MGDSQISRRSGPRLRGGLLTLLGLVLALGGCRQLACDDNPDACPWTSGAYRLEVPPRFPRSGGALMVRRLSGEFVPGATLRVRLASVPPAQAQRDFTLVPPPGAPFGDRFVLPLTALELATLPAGRVVLTVDDGTPAARAELRLYNELSFAAPISGGSGDQRGISDPSKDPNVAIVALAIGPQRVYSLERRSSGLNAVRRFLPYGLNGGGLALDAAVPQELASLYDVSAAEGALFTLIDRDRVLAFNVSGSSRFFLSCRGACVQTDQGFPRLAALTGIGGGGSDATTFVAANERELHLFSVDGDRVNDLRTQTLLQAPRFLAPLVGGQTLLAVPGDGSVTVVRVNDGEAADAAQARLLTSELATLGNGKVPLALAVGDLDGDGLPDLVLVAPDSSRQVILAIDQGNGTYAKVTPPMPFQADIGAPISAVAIGDVDDDGRLDLALGSNVSAPLSGVIGHVRLYINSSTAR